MKKLLTFFLFLPMALHAQLTIRDAVLSMPDSLAPYFSHDNRLDLFDYLDAKMTAEVTNELQGKTTVVAVGVDSIVLCMNESHDLSLYLLQTETEIDSSRQVIALCHTYKLSTGEVERTLKFFNHRWIELENIPRLTDEQLARLQPAISTLLRRDDEVMSRQPILMRQ